MIGNVTENIKLLTFSLLIIWYYKHSAKQKKEMNVHMAMKGNQNQTWNFKQA